MHEKISRKEAKAMGLKFYFTGKECPNGHLALRHVSSYCCVPCGAEWAAKQRAENPTYLENQRKICRENNLKRYHSDPEYKAKVNIQAHASWKRRYKTPEGRAKCDAWSSEWRARNPEKVKAMGDNWKKNNPEKVAFGYSIRACVKRIKKIKGEDFKIAALGYSREDFKSYMEPLFLEGMSWENHGEWHIDHIRPVAAFVKEGNFDLSEIHSLSNLQPLWAKDNRSKGAKESPP